MRIQQNLGEQTVPLRLYTIDAEQVPILLGLRMLVKLEAIIDVSGPWMVLASVSPEVKILLPKVEQATFWSVQRKIG